MSERLTTDNPTNNLETSMNYCFDKDGAAMLSYADSEENVNLCEYTAKCCCEKGCEIDAADVLEDGLMDCTNCPIAIMYYLGVQAVELRARLRHYEDLAEQGRLLELPCKVGDTVFSLWSRVDSKKQHIRRTTITRANLFHYLNRIQDSKSFVTRAEAQAALQEEQNEN